jgi:HK97 family phage prohead protease
MEENRIIRRWSEAPEIRSVDEESRTIEFVASDNTVDSYGTVLPVDKWDLNRYQRNGIVGYMHDVYGESWTKSADPDDIIGKGSAYVEDDRLIVRITFEPKELNERADKIYRKIQFGSLHAVSVGFRATAKGHKGDENRGEDPNVYYYAGQELLEVSVVNIPSNANALKRSIEEERAGWQLDEPEEISVVPDAAECAEEEPDNTQSITARARALLAKKHN